MDARQPQNRPRDRFLPRANLWMLNLASARQFMQVSNDRRRAAPQSGSFRQDRDSNWFKYRVSQKHSSILNGKYMQHTRVCVRAFYTERLN